MNGATLSNHRVSARLELVQVRLKVVLTVRAQLVRDEAEVRIPWNSWDSQSGGVSLKRAIPGVRIPEITNAQYQLKTRLNLGLLG